MRRLFVVLMLALASLDASAHRFAPSLLRVFELGGGQYQVVWKTPAQRASAVPLLPVFPDACSAPDLSAGTLEGTLD